MKKQPKHQSFELLKNLCALHGPSGNEIAVKNFILNYIDKHQKSWLHQPKIITGKKFQDCIILVFGKPRTAVFTHMDSIGFTARYNNQLVKIGYPVVKNGFKLIGKDSKGKINGTLSQKNDELVLSSKRIAETGTEFVFEPNWRETKDFVQCCYMDNRLGVYNSLRLCETITDGVIAFTCWEEHGGGSVSYVQKFLAEKYKISQAIICDITWVTKGVHAGKGVAISMRDSLIPRRSYVDRIIDLASKSGIPFQLEVEGSGGSDAKELQQAEYPWDWIFIGAPEQHVHTPDEKVHKKDIQSMLDIYRYLMKKL